LVHMRELAVDSANDAVHDANSLAANQAEITDALAALDRIASDTSFGTKALLDGTATGLEFQVGSESGQIVSLDLPAVDSTTLVLVAIDVSADAAAALTAIDAAIGTIVTARNTIGSFQANTLESQINYLAAAAENMTSARSVIVDANFASETAAFTKQQILMQAGMQVLSAANQMPQMVLSLLQ
ncbi:MAG TPA: flagellin, partial [Polyangia bacterium]|nr:flagellin [Polyangia bacterium]